VRVAVAVACAAVLASCSSLTMSPEYSAPAGSGGSGTTAESEGGVDSDTNSGTALDVDSAGSEVELAQGTPVSLEATEVSVTKAISAAVGGKVSFRTADQERISLQIPPNALPVDSIITVTQASANGMPAILFEPAGIYLNRPARLTVPKAWASTAYQAFVRAGFVPDGELFAPAARQGDVVLLSRLRPVLFVDGDVVGASVGEQDPVDIVAIAAERDAALGSGGESDPQPEPEPEPESESESESDSDSDSESDGGARDATQAAVTAIPSLAERCREPGAGRQLLEARRAAGAAAPKELPECITRAVHVFAHTDFIWRVEGRTFDIEETVAGLGALSNSTDSSTFPLRGNMAGAAQAASIFMTTVAYGLGTLVGVPVPPPSDDKCSISSLENGIMTASMEDVDDAMVRITLQPAGTYYEVCGRLDSNVEMMSFLILRMLNGVGETDPLVVTLPRNGSSSNVKRMLKIVEQQGLRRKPNGDVVIGDSGMTISVGMTVTIAEQLKDLQPKDDDTDIQP
jgi:hypothetical protein